MNLKGDEIRQAVSDIVGALAGAVLLLALILEWNPEVWLLLGFLSSLFERRWLVRLLQGSIYYVMQYGFSSGSLLSAGIGAVLFTIFNGAQMLKFIADWEEKQNGKF